MKPNRQVTSAAQPDLQTTRVANRVGQGRRDSEFPFDANGFLWAVDQAMAFYSQSREFRSSQVQPIMQDSLVRCDPDHTARHIIDLYAHALDRPLVNLKAAPGLSHPSQIAA